MVIDVVVFSVLFLLLSLQLLPALLRASCRELIAITVCVCASVCVSKGRAKKGTVRKFANLKYFFPKNYSKLSCKIMHANYLIIYIYATLLSFVLIFTIQTKQLCSFKNANPTVLTLSKCLNYQPCLECQCKSN